MLFVRGGDYFSSKRDDGGVRGQRYQSPDDGCLSADKDNARRRLSLFYLRLRRRIQRRFKAGKVDDSGVPAVGAKRFRCGGHRLSIGTEGRNQNGSEPGEHAGTRYPHRGRGSLFRYFLPLPKCPKISYQQGQNYDFRGKCRAITSLQADYYLHNQHEAASLLPDKFRYAGVVSFSGAIFSRHGKVKYPNGNPAPTFILHGTEDRLVPYGQIEFANIGFYGSSKLVKRFEKYHYPYYFKRMKGYGHEVATLLPQMIDEIMFFYQHWVVESKPLQVDEIWYEADYEPVKWGTMKPGDLYKK